MPLTAGTRLGSYVIETLIGSGGMGEVYRARDLQLDRDVAVKILPELFARDPDRLMRFEREAKMLASLNHPCIATPHPHPSPQWTCPQPARPRGPSPPHSLWPAW